MRIYLLTLFTVFAGFLSAQCAIQAEVVDITCNPDSELATVSFVINSDGGISWFSPTLNMEGGYDSNEVYTATGVDLLATGGIQFVDQQVENCSFFLEIDSTFCLDFNVCNNLQVFVGFEPVEECNSGQESALIISVNNANFPVTLQILDSPDNVFFTEVYEEPFGDVFSIPQEAVFTVLVTDAEGCVYEEAVVGEVLPCSAISGNSWLDDGDGVRSPVEETGVRAVVSLFQTINNNTLFIDSTSTDINGNYAFEGVPANRNYRLQIFPFNESFELAPSNQGDESTDSDFDPGSQWSDVFFLSEGENAVLDAGWLDGDCFSAATEIIISDVSGPCGQPQYLLVVEGGTAYPIGVEIAYNNSPNDIFTIDIEEPGVYDLPSAETGVYFVGLIDDNGCVKNFTYVVQQGGNLFAFINQEGSLCADGEVTLFAEVELDPGDLTYEWSTGETTENIIVSQGNLVYSVTVSDENGCSGEADIWVSTQSQDTLIDLPSPLLIPCGEEVITYSIPDPIEGAVYTWIGPEGLTFTGSTVELTAGWYEVFVETVSGCVASGFTQVIGQTLTGVELVSFSEQDSLCGISQCFGLTNLWQFDNNTIEVEWDGPPEFDEWFQNIPNPIQQVCGAEEGFYTVTVRTQCDTLVLTFDNTIRDCSEISGTLYLDTDGDCDLDENDTPAPNFILTLTNDATGEMYYAWTDPNGDWAIDLPGGTYTITPIIEEGQPLSTCPETSVNLSGTAVTGVNIFMPVLESCPLLTTEITIPWLRRCFTGCAYVNYENTGTATGEDAVVTVVLDPFFTDVIPSIDPVSVVGNVYTFNVGDLPPFSNGQIGFIFTVSCDAELGQTHCIDAGITPDEPCSTDENWNGALVDITNVECDGDSLIFTVSNIGENPMSIPLSYVIVEDGIMLSAEPFVNGLLEPGEDYLVSVAAEGATYTLITNQEPNAPGSDEPTTVFEGCNGTGQGFSTGFSNLLPLSSGNPSQSFVCRENVGSYDPNDKMGYPLGWDGGNINEGTRLDYEIRFQNTGTDTAFTVVISDTLSTKLDLATFKMEASSHDYVVTIDTHRVITWTFNNILLPDSTTNLLLSQGSVVFSIDHDESLSPGDSWENEAAIYFDFNEPVITNRTYHVITKDGLPVGVRNLEAQAIRLEVFPNPVSDLLKVKTPEQDIQPNDFLVVTDIHGRPLLNRAYSQLGQGLDVSSLPAGYYLLLVNDVTGRTRGRAPFVVASR